MKELEQKRDELFSAIALQDENKMVELLKANPQLVHVGNEDEYSAVHRCAKHGTKSMMHKLINDFGADINSCTRGFYTPSIIAAEYNNLECLVELVKSGADTTKSDRLGRDALYFLAEENQAIKTFYDSGAELTWVQGADQDHLAIKTVGDNPTVFGLHGIVDC